MRPTRTVMSCASAENQERASPSTPSPSTIRISSTVGLEKVWPADLLLLALGWLGPEATILEELGLEQDERSNALAKHEEYTTAVEGVFVTGDVRRGASLVVWAINEGRGAARSIDEYLMGASDLPVPEFGAATVAV